MSDPQSTPVIMVATDEDFDELIAANMFSPVKSLLNPMKGVPQFSGIASRSFHWLLSRDKLKSMSERDKALVAIRIFTGADFRLQRYTPEEAVSKFKFQDHPISPSVYFRHPYDFSRYLTPNTVNVLLAREKLFVFKEVAGCLGAKTITLCHADVRGHRWLSRTSIADAANQIGIGVSSEKSTDEFSYVFASFDRPAGQPHVPERLKLWVDSERDLQSLIHGRLETKQRRESVIMHVEERSAFHGSIVARYAKLGLNTGGAFQSLHKSLWRYDVEF
jgi:hypothetical protein